MSILNNSKRTFIILIEMVSALYCNGQTWSDVGGGTNNVVYSFKEYNNELYVGGWFDSVAFFYSQSIARWNDTNWNTVGLGLYGTPYSFAFYNNELYAGGDFLYANGISNTLHIAHWNGTQWLSAGSTNNDIGTINVLTTYNNQLYAAGNIVKIGGVNVNRIAKWNGSNWSNVGGGVTGGFALIQCMAIYNGQLYVGGDFTGAGGKFTYNIARWNGSTWDSIPGMLNNIVSSMVVDTVSNVLYVGGTFTMAGTAATKYVAKWNDTAWSTIGNPITNGAIEMEMYHNDLYISCQSSHGLTSDTIIARWNGTDWYWVQGPNGTVSKMEVYNDTLYVGGGFTTPGSNIARYFSPSTSISEEKKTEQEYLGSNIPNPFGTTTVIPYYIPPGSKGIMTISDIEGKPIKTYILAEGSNKLEVDLSDHGNGMYFYTLTIDDGRIIRHKKMILNW